MDALAARAGDMQTPGGYHAAPRRSNAHPPRESLSKVYGLTGGIASGKSTVSRMLRERGAQVVDADQIARDVVAPNTAGLRAVVDAFGDEVLGTDGSLDRARLASIVFGDPEQRATLEGILHPRIATASFAALAEASERTASPVFYDAALLVENGRHTDFAGLVVVSCKIAAQRARIRTRDGLSEDDTHARIAAQLPLSEKVAVADFVIENNGTLAELSDEVDALLRTLETL